MQNSNGHISKAQARNIGIRIPFTEEEAEEFNKYVEDKCINRARFIKTLVLKAIREEKR